MTKYISGDCQLYRHSCDFVCPSCQTENEIEISPKDFKIDGKGHYLNRDTDLEYYFDDVNDAFNATMKTNCKQCSLEIELHVTRTIEATHDFSFSYNK